MTSHRIDPIRVGVLTEEPLRLEGIACIFEHAPGEGYAPLAAVIGSIEELLGEPTLEFLIVDLNSFSGGIDILESIRNRRPDMRMIVIGPEGDDDLVMKSIIAGARAYLDLKASPRIVRQAVEVVTSGSIWASRRLLSALIDRLLVASDASLTNGPPHLTDRERQVLDLLLTARSYREIAQELGIEERTVKAHVAKLMRKVGVQNRIALSVHAITHSLVSAR